MKHFWKKVFQGHIPSPYPLKGGPMVNWAQGAGRVKFKVPAGCGDYGSVRPRRCAAKKARDDDDDQQ